MTDPDQLFILAFDHRASLPATLGLDGSRIDASQAATLGEAKELAFQSLRNAAIDVPARSAGFLVDEELGADVAGKVKPSGLILAMPVEKSGSDLFEFVYPDWQNHIERFDPDFVKVLVRWNPDGDSNANQIQGERLALLSSWLREHDRRLLFELLVPATDAQLAAADNDSAVYDSTMRPNLACCAIEGIRNAGAEPDIWKLEGVDERSQAERLVATAREGGRDHVRCVVLGRGADIAKVDEWLRVAAPVDGFCGFAIGRSIWADAIRSWIRGRSSSHTAIGEMAERYKHFVAVYMSAESGETND
jgi:myo-inositol catabolism protein IolC